MAKGWQKMDNSLFLNHGRIVILQNASLLKRRKLSEFHDAAGHIEWRRTYAKLLCRYWWRSMVSDV